MTNLLDVARMGRANALARIGGHSLGGASAGRSRSGAGTAALTFSSVRGQR